MTGKTPKRNERPGVDRIGRTPLHYAALEGRLEEATRLLGEGVSPLGLAKTIASYDVAQHFADLGA